MTTKKRHLFMLIHGPYGTGKTTLASTAPGPQLWLDAEGGAQDINMTVVDWDPSEPVPAMEDPANTAVVVDIHDWKTYRMALDVVQSGNHPFNTVILDSLTEIQKQLKDALMPDNDFGNYKKADYDTWDQLLVFMENDVRKFRNLSRVGSKRPVNVIIVAASNVEEYPRRPILQGALRRSLPGFVDVEGYLHVEHVVDDQTGEKQERHVLDISPHDESVAEVKCRPPLLKEAHGSAIWDPNIKRILRTVNPRPTKATTTNKETDNG